MALPPEERDLVEQPTDPHAPVVIVPSLPVVGRTLGEFVVKDKIGEGGFGDVFRAEQPVLHREAVIKVLNPGLRESDEANTRFLREARLASRLDHPYAAHIYAFGVEPDGLRWIAMEYVRGTPLSQLLLREGALSLERFLPLLERICEVVHSAHEKGIIHRDLKPANVMVMSRAGRLLPKLLDFGIAKAVDAKPVGVITSPTQRRDGTLSPTAVTLTPPLSQTADGPAIGSPHFMAPEQWVEPGAIDARTDLYALGVLTFAALTRQVPFNGRFVEDVSRAHRFDPVPPLGPPFPEALDAVLARAMAKKQHDRYRDVLEFARAMRAAAGIDDDAEALPRLEPGVASRLGDAPQPLAEALAALDGARNAHQARDAYVEILHLLSRLLGILSLCSRSLTGPGADVDRSEVLDALQQLRRRDLADEEWLALAASLVAPFADNRDAHPLPELVGCFHDPGGGGALLAAILAENDTAAVTGSDEDVRATLAKRLPRLAELLGALGFLVDYQLVVRQRGVAERWMGVRRTPRRVLAVTEGRPLTEGHPALIDGLGRPVLSLYPLVQVAAPSPGAPPELFLFDGKGRSGARLTASPLRFERADASVWEWLAAHFLPEGEVTLDRDLAEGAPYRGLAAYTRDDAALFFGRDKQVEAFVNRLRVQAFLVVVGPSGAGKSSFVQAGVVAALPAREGWRVITVRPGPAPFAGLAARLAAEGLASEGLADDPALLGELLRRARDPILLVVDQFEEVFTLGASAEEQRRYAEALAGAGRAADESCRVVLTLRDDFLARAEALPALSERLAPGLQLLGVPAPAELVQTLVGPARRAGYDFDEPDLPARMVQAVAGQPSALALLSFTASRLWELRDRHFKQLTRKAHDALGGVGGALATHAESVLEGMPAGEQRLVREAFRHLVTAEGTRAVLTRGELRQLLAAERADQVVEKLIAARLLVASETESGEDRIEIVHEALLDAWPRLRGWRHEHGEDARLRDQVRAAARQWQERGRPSGLLWRKEALRDYRMWRARSDAPLTAVEEAFGAASVREARRGRTWIVGLVVTAFLALGGFLIKERNSSRLIAEQRALAQQRLLDSYAEQGRLAYVSGDAGRALVYLAAAVEQGGHDDDLAFLVTRASAAVRATDQRVIEERSPVYIVRFTPDEKAVVAATLDTGLAVWDVEAGKRTLELDETKEFHVALPMISDTAVLAARADGLLSVYSLVDGSPLRRMSHGARISAAVLDPTRTRAASVGDDGAARVWDVGRGGLVTTFTPNHGPLRSVDLSSDGRLLVTGSSEGTVSVFDLQAATLVRELHAEGPATKVLFTRDGKAVLAVHDDAVGLWGIDGTRRGSGRHAGTIRFVEIDPTGKLVVTASDDGSVRLWSASDLSLVHVLGGHGGGARTARFSPTGRELLTGAGNGLLRVWDVGTGKSLATYSGHDSDAISASWNADGTRFASGGRDQTVRTWHWRPETRFRGNTAGVFALAFRPDGRELVTIGEDNVVRVFEPTTTRLLRSWAGPVPAAMWNVTFTPDGERLVFARTDGVVGIADAQTGEVITTILAHQGEAGDAQLTPDGTHLVTAGYQDHSSALWEVRSGTLRWRHPHEEKVVGTALSPDGRWLATNAWKIDVWDVASGALRVSLAGLPHFYSVGWSRDGQRLITGGRDGSVELWDPSTGRAERALSPHERGVYFVGFGAMDHIALSAGLDGMLIHSVAKGHALASFSTLAGSVTGTLSADGRWGAAAFDDVVYIWDLGLDEVDPSGVQALSRCLPFILEDGVVKSARSRCSPP